MDITLRARPNAESSLERLQQVLLQIPERVVACSGGIDSLLLATVAHRASSLTTSVAHTVTPAVPQSGTERVQSYAANEGWSLHIVTSGEFDDERYLSNPTNRCYWCKSNLYDAVTALVGTSAVPDGSVVLSGANLDDLGEYRPGLEAAAEHGVRHPYIEAEMGKPEIRVVAAHLGLLEASLPASPCLASRLYTGTRVTPSRLRAVEAGESMVTLLTGIDVVRCRLDEAEVRVEVLDADRARVTVDVLARVTDAMRKHESELSDAALDAAAYAPGRAIPGAAG